MSNPTSKPSDASLVKIEAPKELPKVSLVNESLKKLKFHLAKFNNLLKIRTTHDARTEGEYEFEHTKSVFNNEIIPFLKSLKDIFNVFDRDLLNEIMEVKTVFEQMKASVQQFSVDKQCLKIAKKELLLENDRLLQQIIKESCNLEAKLLKSQNAFNDLLKRYSQLKRHCISFGSSIQLNQAIFQKDESRDNQNALEIPEFFENNDLKAQLQDKDITIYNLKDIIKSMREKSKEENVNYDYCEIATKNVKLENSVAKLLSENEHLCNEINHVKQIVLSEDEAVERDSSKQGRSLIEELDMDADISLVPPHDAEIQEKISDDTKVTTANTALNTASVPISTAIATPEVSTTAKNLVYIRRSAEKKKDKGKAIMIEDESVQKKSKKQLEQERIKEYDKAGKKEVVAEVDTAHVIDWNDPSVIRYHALQHRPRSVAEVRKNMIMYLKNQGGYKMKDFKGMSYDDIRPIYEKVWDQVHSFVPMDSEEEVHRLKKAGQDVKAKPAKRQRTKEVSESVQEQIDKLSQEQLNQMVIIVPDEGINVEALQTKYPIIGWEVYSEDTIQFWKIIRVDNYIEVYKVFEDILKNIDRDDLVKLWSLVQERYNSSGLAEDKEIELWVELKMLFEPNVKNLLELQKYMHDHLTENEDLKAQIQDKVFVITSLKNDLQKVKGKEIVDIGAQIPSANTIVLGMFKLDLEPLAPSAKKVVVTPKNKVKKVRIAEPFTSSSNIKQVESSKTSDSNTPMLSSTGLNCSTSKCGSKPICNKKNHRISQTTSKNMKNKVEAQPRKVNKKNHVVEPIHDINVNHSLLNANFEPICANCKKYMFDGVHDMCILDFVENVNSWKRISDKKIKNQVKNGQNRTRNGKAKTNLSLFHVFGTLCYPTNDNDDLGKLDAKRIGIFVGYAPAKKAFRIYNKRTLKIIETIHVTYDELTAMASEKISLGPGLHSMTLATSSSGLIPNTVSQQPCTPPNRDDWDHLFQPMFDEYFNPPSIAVTPVQDA
ncbi:hypothetical protein Tco_0838994 [Tanacetum coccineum]|uniref:Retroviral polymerase SH3-like domain-containing protein n=1 Tax=Tanacetum coccineum TaxID=301880 RepID=A0ABQ5ARV8_9ASTR